MYICNDACFLMAYFVCNFSNNLFDDLNPHNMSCATSTDLSRAIDSSVKEKINDLTGNDDYEFGDLR